MTVPAEKAPEVAELQTDDTSGPLPTRDYAGAWRVARPDATCNHAPRVGSQGAVQLPRVCVYLTIHVVGYLKRETTIWVPLPSA